MTSVPDAQLMDRRTLLKLLGALGVGPFMSSGVHASDTPEIGLFLLVDDIFSGLSVPQLRALLEPLARELIPVGLALRASDGEPDEEVAGFIAEILVELPGLFEPVLRTDGLLELDPYFQLRSASQALARLEQSFTNPSARFPRISTVADRAPPTARAQDSLRAVGLRNVLQLTQRPAFAVSSPCDQAAVCLRGSVPITFDNGIEELRTRLQGADADGANLVAVLSGADLRGRTVDDILRQSEALAREIVAAVQDQRAFVVLPKENLVWFGGTSPPAITVLLELPLKGDGEAESAFAQIQWAFNDAGIPYSLTGSAIRLQPLAPDVCPTVDTGTVDLDWIAKRFDLALPACAVGEMPLDLAANSAAAGLSVVFDPSHIGNPKLDRHGLMHWPVEDAQVARTVRGTDDLVIQITAKDYRDPIRRNGVLAALAQPAGEPPKKLSALSGFVSDILPRDPVFDMLRETQRDLRIPDAKFLETEEQRTEMLRDARAAWQKIARHTDEETLLCPGTVHHNPDGTYAFRALTMWDLGSLIRATLAAHELGFITEVEFAVRAEALIDALPASRIGGAMLPNELISTQRIETLSNNFNVCDTGRLLGALHSLDRYPQSRGIAAPAVARWDLDAVIIRGHPHSVVGGRKIDDFLSHCAHYLARAFRVWGLEIDSPFEIDRSESTTDWQMRVMYAAADIGAYGAEPLLFEATEFGLSEPSRLLADVLWTAQRRTWRETGQLVCVSEAPLDRSPWFVYSGLRLADPDDRWVTRTRSSDPAHATERFQRESLLVNTKGAFLWAAARPGEHSTRLLDFVRERARNVDGSLSPGVYSATGHGMPGYTDLNTHGVILDTVAYIFRGRRPRSGEMD